MYVCIYYTHTYGHVRPGTDIDHCGPLICTILSTVYVTRVSALVGLESPSSVYTDGIEDHSHAAPESRSHSSLEQERPAWVQCAYVLHDPARPRYCSTAVAVWGDVTPSKI